MFDLTVNLGNVLTIIAFLTGGLGFVYTVRGKVEAIAFRLLSFENEIRRLTDILVVQGRQEERMNAMDARLASQGTRLDDVTARFNKRTDPE
jgi:hypothetical protein